MSQLRDSSGSTGRRITLDMKTPGDDVEVSTDPKTGATRYKLHRPPPTLSEAAQEALQSGRGLSDQDIQRFLGRSR